MTPKNIPALAQERIDEIINAIEYNGGYQFPDGRMMMSFWELADTLNNSWVARLFVNEDKVRKVDRWKDDVNFVVEDYDLWKFRTRIRSACRASPRLEWVDQKGIGFIFLKS